MNNALIEKLKAECRTIEDNARHTAEAHHILASKSKRLGFWFEVVPAATAAFSGLLVIGQIVPGWWGWITVVSAVMTATSGVVRPYRSYYDSLNAAKCYTVIKHKARALHETFADFYTEQDLFKEVKSLTEHYNQLISLTPPTEEWAYKKAVKKLSPRNRESLIVAVLRQFFS